MLELEESITQTLNIASGSNFGDAAQNRLNFMISEKDELLGVSRSVEEIENEDSEVESFWLNLRNGK